MTGEPGFALHPLAAQDITEIWEYIAADNPLAAGLNLPGPQPARPARKLSILVSLLEHVSPIEWDNVVFYCCTGSISLPKAPPPAPSQKKAALSV